MCARRGAEDGLDGVVRCEVRLVERGVPGDGDDGVGKDGAQEGGGVDAAVEQKAALVLEDRARTIVRLCSHRDCRGVVSRVLTSGTVLQVV